jgi:hypothetical protein
MLDDPATTARMAYRHTQPGTRLRVIFLSIVVIFPVWGMLTTWHLCIPAGFFT